MGIRNCIARRKKQMYTLTRYKTVSKSVKADAVRWHGMHGFAQSLKSPEAEGGSFSERCLARRKKPGDQRPNIISALIPHRK
jgi:hypothetical protein